jgi:hypothetical protein
MIGSRHPLLLVLALLTAVLAGCGSGERDAEVPQMLRQRFQTEMRTILRDIKMAEEQAMALEGQYLELGELKRKYFNRPVPDSYTLSLTEVSSAGFQAELVHQASGLSCRLEVGGAGAGIPTCD